MQYLFFLNQFKKIKITKKKSKTILPKNQKQSSPQNKKTPKFKTKNKTNKKKHNLWNKRIKGRNLKEKYIFKEHSEV